MSLLIPAYTGSIPDHSITAIMDILNVPISDKLDFVIEGTATLKFTRTVARDTVFDRILEFEAQPEVEARVLSLVREWDKLPAAGRVEKDGHTFTVQEARHSIRKRLQTIYPVFSSLSERHHGHRVTGR